MPATAKTEPASSEDFARLTTAAVNSTLQRARVPPVFPGDGAAPP